MIHQFTSIYVYLLHGNSLAQLKITRSIETYSPNWKLLAQLKITRSIENYSPTWLLLVAMYLHIEHFILCILYWTGAEQRLRCGYTSAIFCLYKVSCVDWIGNFINFEPSKFGYYLVNFWVQNSKLHLE